jgi:putative sterol carrier protein
MTTLSELVQPLKEQCVAIIAQLPVATRDATKLTVVLHAIDSHQIVRVVIDGTTVTVTEDDGSANMRLTAPAALFATMLQQGSMRFVTEPIVRGKLRNLHQLQGALQLTLTDGGEVRITFNDATQPEAVVKMSSADATGLLAGTLNPQVAVMTGRMQIVSGMSFLMSLDRIM